MLKLKGGETRSNLPRLEQISEIFNMDICELLTYGEEEKIVNLAQSVFNNSENSLNHAIISLGSSELQKEIEKFQLIIQHKDELLKYKNTIIENQKQEIELLREMNSILKSSK